MVSSILQIVPRQPPPEEALFQVAQRLEEAFRDRGVESRIVAASPDRARYEQELASAAAFLRAEDQPDPARRPAVRRLRAALLFIDGNRQLPLLSWPGEVVDRLIAAEQAMLVFRQRHARMVERVIGRRVGTGGSDGVDSLDRTALGYRVFRELWATRTLLIEAGQAPPVRNADYYGLRVEEP